MFGLFLALNFAAATVQKQFILPPSLRYPLYDVKVLHEPIPGLDNYPPSRIVALTHEGKPIKCVTPELGAETENVEIEPLKDEQLLAKARAAISNLLGITYISTFDDIWGWYISFNSTVVQFLPTRTEASGLLISPENYQVSVGSPGKKPGQNLRTAEAVVVDDRHMLMATFVNGTMCDITGQSRISRLFFMCDPRAVQGPILKSVQEPYACVYEHVIGTNYLCAFPEFTGFQTEPNHILCGPHRLENTAKHEEL